MSFSEFSTLHNGSRVVDRFINSRFEGAQNFSTAADNYPDVQNRISRFEFKIRNQSDYVNFPQSVKRNNFGVADKSKDRKLRVKGNPLSALILMVLFTFLFYVYYVQTVLKTPYSSGESGVSNSLNSRSVTL